MQFQADILGIPVERPAVFDATAQAAAFGAGLVVGLADYSALVAGRRINRIFYPGRGATQAQIILPYGRKSSKASTTTAPPPSRCASFVPAKAVLLRNLQRSCRGVSQNLVCPRGKFRK